MLPKHGTGGYGNVLLGGGSSGLWELCVCKWEGFSPANHCSKVASVTNLSKIRIKCHSKTTE